MSNDNAPEHRPGHRPDGYRPPPWLKEFPQDMLNDERLRWAPLAARGAVWWLRMQQWLSPENCIPSDPRKLCHLLGCERAELDAVLPVVLDFFAPLGPDSLQDVILAARRDTTGEVIEKNRRNGQKGGLAKAKAHPPPPMV